LHENNHGHKEEPNENEHTEFPASSSKMLFHSKGEIQIVSRRFKTKVLSGERYREPKRS